MKKTIIITIIAVLLCGQVNFGFAQVSSTIDCSKLPANPTPHSAVNDFANIIDESDQIVIENKLRSYWDSTSIAICVVTIPTLDEYDQFDYSYSLFNCWGIGGKDNRGVLLFISLKEKKISIRTGTGIEPFLTDGQSGEIVRDLKPYFKEKKYGKGISKSVDEMISIFGLMSWEDRMEGLQQRKHAEEKASAEMKDFFMNILLLIAFIALSIFIGYRINKARQKARFVNMIKERIKHALAETEKAAELLDQSLKSFDQSPSWAKKEAEGHVAMCRQSIAQANALLSQASSLLSENIATADQNSRESLMIIDKAFKGFVKLNESLKEKVKKIEEETPLKFAEAQKVVADNVVKLLEYMRGIEIGNTPISGYRFDTYLAEQKRFEDQLLGYESRLTDKDSLSKIYTDSGIIKEKSDLLMKEVVGIIARKSSVDNGLHPLINRGFEISSHQNDWSKLIDVCKLKYPSTVWGEIEKKLTRAIDKLSREKLESVQAEIIRMNSMSVQEFGQASMKYDSLSVLVTETENVYTSLKTIFSEQEKSKETHPGVYQNTKDVVEKAMNAVKDSDVSSTTRNIAKEASQKLRDTKIESEKTLVDWIAIIALLSSIQQLAEKAIRKAKDDISDAEDERRRDAERARQRQEESYRSSSFTTYSSSSESSSGSGSFGGFDGGSSSGGGADGGW